MVVSHSFPGITKPELRGSAIDSRREQDFAEQLVSTDKALIPEVTKAIADELGRGPKGDSRKRGALFGELKEMLIEEGALTGDRAIDEVYQSAFEPLLIAADKYRLEFLSKVYLELERRELLEVPNKESYAALRAAFSTLDAFEDQARPEFLQGSIGWFGINLAPEKVIKKRKKDLFDKLLQGSSLGVPIDEAGELVRVHGQHGVELLKVLIKCKELSVFGEDPLPQALLEGSEAALVLASRGVKSNEYTRESLMNSLESIEDELLDRKKELFQIARAKFIESIREDGREDLFNALEENGQLEVRVIEAAELARWHAAGRIIWREPELEVGTLNLKLNEREVPAKTPKIIQMADEKDSSPYLVINGNRRLFQALFINPDRQLLPVVSFQSPEMWEELVGFPITISPAGVEGERRILPDVISSPSYLMKRLRNQ